MVAVVQEKKKLFTQSQVKGGCMKIFHSIQFNFINKIPVTILSHGTIQQEASNNKGNDKLPS